MNQRICEHCGHPTQHGWGEMLFVFMGKTVQLDVCPDCVPIARKLLADFAVFNPDLFHKQKGGDRG